MKRLSVFMMSVLLCISLLAGCDRESDTPEDLFAGDCGITVVAQVQKNELGWLDLELNVTNMTDQKVTAVRFFAVLLNAQGNPVGGDGDQIFIALGESLPIEAQKSVKETLTVSRKYARSLELYVVYVEYADGSTWGDRQASEDQIFDRALTVVVNEAQDPSIGSGS